MRVPARFSLLLLWPLAALSSVFDASEVAVAPSPGEPSQIRLGDGSRVLDLDVSPAGPRAALLVTSASGGREVQLWDVGRSETVKIWEAPSGFAARSLAWHPVGDALFVSGPESVFRLDRQGEVWKGRRIYSSSREIRRLLAAPRPYAVEYIEKRREFIRAYRLFFGVKENDGRFSIHSVTEEGKHEYQVVGRKGGITRVEDVSASEITADYGLPASFHPAGHLLIWENERGCFQVARYARDRWGESAKLFGRDLCGGAVTATPNGAAILHWQAGREGVDLLQEKGTKTSREAAGYQFVSVPSSTPDGRGIVGVTRTEAGLAVNYVPIRVPLADVVNAWMYLESGQNAAQLADQGGLFRDLKDMDQLYSLYDTEAYYCGGYDESSPTRPYLVTTDVFWELFAAAYEGIFIVRERQTAIPAFWQFVTKAHAGLRQSHPHSRWTAVFAALGALQSKDQGNPEAALILKSTGRRLSPILQVDFDYGEIKPRGHYTASDEAQRYFRAFRYLTQVSKLEWSAAELAVLRQLPPEAKLAALRWIGAYQDMISPSRSPLMWQDRSSRPPQYVKRPQSQPVLFPLSWGFDNEVLLSTVFHPDWPEEERIEGPKGRRSMASALDVAAALDSRLARELLSDEISRYPRLGPVLTELAARPRSAESGRGPSLYQQWIDTLAVQWADSVAAPNGKLDERLWRVKRLQTGLASWATLRHATVLVNERTGAECGEGGFEAIIMRPPRGYVEPDPETFEQIARLFDSAKQLVGAADLAMPGMLPREEGEGAEALKQGLIRRLHETAAKARMFGSMATKEIHGQPLTASEYEHILQFGGVAEHHFLIFKSLANKDLALSTPNPIPKIADVADVAGGAPYLLVAVGRPLEWDHTVPFFGRHEIVKGAAYSFYQFVSNTLVNDEEWLKQLPTQPHPAWVAPFMSANALSCPARDPF